MPQNSLQRLHSAVAMGRVDVRGRIDSPAPAVAPQRSSVATRIAYFESAFDNSDKIDAVKLAALHRQSATPPVPLTDITGAEWISWISELLPADESSWFLHQLERIAAEQPEDMQLPAMAIDSPPTPGDGFERTWAAPLMQVYEHHRKQLLRARSGHRHLWAAMQKRICAEMATAPSLQTRISEWGMGTAAGAQRVARRDAAEGGTVAQWTARRPAAVSHERAGRRARGRRQQAHR